MIILVSVFFFSHYMFASSTAHATAMMPVMLAVGRDDPRHADAGLFAAVCA